MSTLRTRPGAIAIALLAIASSAVLMLQPNPAASDTMEQRMEQVERKLDRNSDWINEHKTEAGKSTGQWVEVIQSQGQEIRVLSQRIGRIEGVGILVGASAVGIIVALALKGKRSSG